MRESDRKTIRQIERMFLRGKTIYDFMLDASIGEEPPDLRKLSDAEHLEFGEIIKKKESDGTKLNDILDRHGDIDKQFVMTLFHVLTNIAERKLVAALIADVVTDRRMVADWLIDKAAVERAVKVRGVHTAIAKNPYLMGNSKGGKKRPKKHELAYMTHKEYWDKWQQDPSLYAGVTAYDEAMRDKTGAGSKTVFNHRKKFEGHP